MPSHESRDSDADSRSSDADSRPSDADSRPSDTAPRYPAPDSRLVLEPDCARCPALADSRECISWGNGPPDADVLVVGEAPGAGNPDADRWQGGNHTGLAYTSRHSGRRIRRLFEDLGYGDRTFYTNAVKCFPSDGEGSNREPTDEELATCRDHLVREVEVVDPGVVVATGKHATRSVLAVEGREVDGFLELVLERVECPRLGVPLVPILHPSYQDVWVTRLGYEPEAYREAVGATVAAELG